MYRRLFLLVALVLSLPLAGLQASSLSQVQGQASQTVILNRIDSGWYDQSGWHDYTNTNYVAGECCSVGFHRNFFVFSLAGIVGTITSATLQVVNPSASGGSYTYTLYDVATSIGSLLAGYREGHARTDVYADLGTGVSYGSLLISDPTASPIRVDLNSTGLAAIQAALGQSIALGGDYSEARDEYIFGGSDQPDGVQLILEVLLQEVVVDIIPGSTTNPVNLKSQGLIPVALLATATFDAQNVDPLSVSFGPSKAREAHDRGHVEDVDGDGDLDVLLHFHIQKTGLQCGMTSASLSGSTTDGQLFTKSDSITIKGCH